MIGARVGVKEDALAVAAGINMALNSVGSALKEHGGNSTLGSNHSFYWHAAGERGFYGNQHVSTVKLTTIGNKVTKVTGPVGKLIDIYNVGMGIYNDYQNYQNTGYTDGYNTVRATADVAGGWAGALAGLKVGGLIGGSIGSIPGAVIGGIIGGVGGAFGGSYVGILSVDKAYGR